MEIRPIYDYIWLGTSLRWLQDVEEDMTLHGDGFVLHNIESFLDGLKQFRLAVTRRAAEFGLVPLQKELAEEPADAVLTEAHAQRLNGIMTELRQTLEAEALGNVAYVVGEKRYDVRKLMGNPQALVGRRVWDWLSDTAKRDFGEAGRCIAFEMPTAAAFHLMRGTEEALRGFYRQIVRRDRVHPLMWGPMVSHLRQRRRKPPEALLDNLDNIRRSFRNPTQHPEAFYDIEEAENLFGLCVDVVTRMKNSAQ